MELQKLRELRLLAPSRPGRLSHLSAASGLVKVGATFYVVADDELHLAAFGVTGTAPGTLRRLLDGDLPDAAEERKKRKPDFEALTLLPPFSCYPHGALLALGSGSKQQRCRGVLLGLDARGLNATSPPRVLDASNLFERAAQEVDELNIEGAVVLEERLVLMHRGNKSHCDNCLLSFGLGEVLASIEHDDRVGKVPLLAVQRHNFGTLDGVPLCFTDGAALPDGRLVFAAVAEDTQDSYSDGPFRGAVIGVIGSNGRPQVLHYLEGAYKVEGLHVEPSGSRLQLWLVTDPDDANVPAVLLRGEIVS